MNRYPWEWVHCSLDNSRLCCDHRPIISPENMSRCRSLFCGWRFWDFSVLIVNRLYWSLRLFRCFAVESFFNILFCAKCCCITCWLVAVPFCTVWHSRPSCSVAAVWICMVQWSYAAVYSIQLTITISTCPRSKQATDVPCAPHGLRGCKNRHAPFPGRMSYKATKPGLVCVLYLSML